MANSSDSALKEQLSAALPSELQYGERQLRAIHRRAAHRQLRHLGAVALIVATTVGTGYSAIQVLTPDDNAVMADGAAREASPAPWSDEVVTGPADGSQGLVLPETAYLVAQGKTPAGTWRVASARVSDDSHGCLFEYGGGAFAQPQGICFDSWRAEEVVQWRTWGGQGESSTFLVVGAVGNDARTVRLTLDDGTVLSTDAVATPSSQDLRFFAVDTGTTAKVTDVEALTGDGEFAESPDGLPWTSGCSGTDTTCPARPSPATD